MRSTLLTTGALLSILSSAALAQGKSASRPASERPPSDAALIADALSAAPTSVAAGATVMNHDGRVLRKGTTDWVCMPDIPEVPNDTPMSLDAPWRSFIVCRRRLNALAGLGPLSAMTPRPKAATARRENRR